MLIKNGDDGLLPTLWEQVRRFIAWKAKKHLSKFENHHGAELDDLIQSGYFAVVAAVGYYKPGFKFTTFLGNCLLTAFNSAMGLRSEKRDWLNYAASLDESIGGEGDMTLLDKIGDLTPRHADIEETVIASIWNQELRAALDDAMGILSKSQREVLELHYYFGLNYEQIGEMRGTTRSNIQSQEDYAFNRIQKSRHLKILAGFLYNDGKIENPYSRSYLSSALREVDNSLEDEFLINWR